jgi:hypothetical protein
LDSSCKGILTSESTKALSGAQVEGFHRYTSDARVWSEGFNADALAPQRASRREVGSDERERANNAGRSSGSDGSDHGEPAVIAWCAPLSSTPDAFSARKARYAERLPLSRAISNTALIGDDSALDVLRALPLIFELGAGYG